MIDAIWCYLMLFDAIWCYLMLFDAIWCYLMLFDAIWCYIESIVYIVSVVCFNAHHTAHRVASHGFYRADEADGRMAGSAHGRHLVRSGGTVPATRCYKWMCWHSSMGDIPTQVENYMELHAENHFFPPKKTPSKLGWPHWRPPRNCAGWTAKINGLDQQIHCGNPTSLWKMTVFRRKLHRLQMGHVLWLYWIIAE